MPVSRTFLQRQRPGPVDAFSVLKACKRDGRPYGSESVLSQRLIMGSALKASEAKSVS